MASDPVVQIVKVIACLLVVTNLFGHAFYGAWVLDMEGY